MVHLCWGADRSTISDTIKYTVPIGKSFDIHNKNPVFELGNEEHSMEYFNLEKHKHYRQLLKLFKIAACSPVVNTDEKVLILDEYRRLFRWYEEN